jgi:hypothetical protein
MGTRYAGFYKAYDPLSHSHTMPIDFAIYPERRLIVTTGWGVLTLDDLLDHEKRLAAHPDFVPDLAQLLDFSGVEEPRLHWKDMHAVAVGCPLGKQSRRALVAGTDEMYGIGRMYQLVADREDQDMQVFRDGDEARRWLGIDAPGNAAGKDADAARAPGRDGNTHPPRASRRH